MTRRNILFVKFGGLKFLDAAHVKDVLALLRMVENPRDRIAGYRDLQLLPGNGPATAEAVFDAMRGALEPSMALPAFPFRRGRGKRGRCRRALCRSPSGDVWPAEIERAIGWYRPHLERLHQDGVRSADLSSSSSSPPATRRASAS